MAYVVIIGVLAALDLGFKWLIERQEPGAFPRPLKHTNEKIRLYRNHNAGFPSDFWRSTGRWCARFRSSSSRVSAACSAT